VDQSTQIGAVNRALRGQPAEAVAAAIVSIREALAAHLDGASVRLPGLVGQQCARLSEPDEKTTKTGSKPQSPAQTPAPKLWIEASARRLSHAGP
jgi:hypothetical protein